MRSPIAPGKGLPTVGARERSSSDNTCCMQADRRERRTCGRRLSRLTSGQHPGSVPFADVSRALHHPGLSMATVGRAATARYGIVSLPIH